MSPPPLLEQPLVGRLLAGRLVAGPRAEDALRLAGGLVAAGRLVALEHTPGRGGDVAAELAALVARLPATGLAASCEVTLPVDRLGAGAARDLAAAVTAAGASVVLAGDPGAVDVLAARLPGARVVVVATEPHAEPRCRDHAGGRVRLQQAAPVHRARADLVFVRCLNVLMSAGGRPQVAATDPRLIAIAGERAAWNGRAPDSWEHLMPYRIRGTDQQRLVAAGSPVRVAVPSGAGAPAALLRGLAARS